MNKWTAGLLAALILPPVYIGFADDTANEENGPETSEADGEVASKEEVIYGNLNHDGSVTDLYVVNMLDVTSAGRIVDYGDYDSVQNLTSLAEIQIDGNEVTAEAEEGWFYYQGNKDGATLPWAMGITYTLDGEEVDAGDLAGADGHLHMNLTTEANDGVNPSFYENYTLQVSVSFDASVAGNIHAPDATVANAGKERQLSYTVMPETDGDIEFFADVTDFEMNGIEIAAIPMTLAMEDPDTGEMVSELRDLSDGIAEIYDGVGELNDGVFELVDGLWTLTDGSSDFLSGLREVDDSSGDLVHGSREIRDGLAQLDRELDVSDFDRDVDLSGFDELTRGLHELSGGLEELSGGLGLLGDQYEEARQALDEAVQAIPEDALSEEDIQALYMTTEDHKTLDSLVDQYAAAQRVKQTYDAVSGAFDAVTDTLGDAVKGLDESVKGLRTMASELEASLASFEDLEDPEALEGLRELERGIAELSSNYHAFHDGLISYTGGVGELAGNYGELDDGVSEAADGTRELGDGTGELYDGTGELEENTRDLPDQIQDEVDELMAEYDKSDYEPVSFVSERNEQVSVVQFVLRTEAIELPDDEDGALEEEDDESWFDRIMNLFS